MNVRDYQPTEVMKQHQFNQYVHSFWCSESDNIWASICSTLQSSQISNFILLAFITIHVGFTAVRTCFSDETEYKHTQFIQHNKILFTHYSHMSLAMRKPVFGICENKDADQLRGNRKADQRLCFRHKDSTIPLHPKSETSSL